MTNTVLPNVRTIKGLSNQLVIKARVTTLNIYDPDAPPPDTTGRLSLYYWNR
ncbi:MAG: hypothetical protein ACXAEU_13695 [Candidatus Hodarchaeales archaeon]